MKINQLKAGIMLSYVLILVNAVTGIFLTPFMLTNLGQSQYGLYQLIGAFVGYMAIFDFGLGNAVIRYVAQYRQLQDKKGETNFLAMTLILYGAISIVVIVLGMILYLNLDNIFNRSFTAAELAQAKIMFIILVFNLVISLFGNTFNAVINAYERYVFTRGLAIIRLIVRVTALVVLLRLGYNAISIVILDTIINLTTTVVNIIICKTQLDIIIKLYKFDKKLLFEIVSYSIFIFLNIIFDQLIWTVSPTIIGIKMSTTAVAIFAVGTQIAVMFMQFSTAISGIFLPKITKLVVEGVSNEVLTDFMIRVGRIQGIILLYIYIGFVLFGREFIQLWVGDVYREAYTITLLLMTGLLIPLMESVGLSILQAMKRHQFYVITYLFVCIFSVIVTILIIDDTGIIGAAMMTMLGLFIGHGAFINWYYYRKIGLDIPRFFKELVKGIFPAAIISGLIMYFIMGYVQISSWIMFTIIILLFTSIYFISIWFFGANKYEKDIILQIINKVL